MNKRSCKKIDKPFRHYSPFPDNANHPASLSDNFKGRAVLNEIISNLPDGRAENELVKYLKKIQVLERENLIFSLLSHESDYVRASMLKIVPRVTISKDALYRILDTGLAKRNPSGIKLWLKATASGLGYEIFLDHLQNTAEIHPEWVACAWYHLVPMVVKNAAGCSHFLDAIRIVVDANIQEEMKAFWKRSKESVLY